MSEYSSREMPSGFRVDCRIGFLSCDGPGVEEGPGRDRILRTSAAVAAMMER